MLEELTLQAKEAVTGLLEVARLQQGDILVVGCSSSEVGGQKIGSASSPQVAQAILEGIYPVLRERGIYLAAICAAPTILAHQGFLDRRKAVCYPGMEDEMGSAVVQKGKNVVVDGHIITAEAAGSAFDFGLKLVETLRGPAAAEQVRESVHYRR